METLVTNENEARLVINLVSEWLKKQDGRGEGYAADLSREFSRIMLKSADADGMNGCRLCRS